MTATFLKLLDKLANTSSASELEKVSKKVSQWLSEDKEFSESLFYPMINNTIRQDLTVALAFDEDFGRLRIAAYQDSDGLTKIAVGVSFLQDHGSHSTSLDREIYELIEEEVKQQKLQLIINDVTINQLQVRDWATGSLL